MLSAVSVIAKVLVVPVLLSAPIAVLGSGAPASAQDVAPVHATLQPGTSTKVYYENGERVEETTEVIRVSATNRRGKQYSPPTNCKTIYPRGYMWVKKGLCHGHFYVHAQALGGKKVFAHVGVIDDRGKAFYSSSGWSHTGGYSEGSVKKTSHCKKKCTVKLTYRTK